MPSAASLDPQLQAILREFQQGLQTLYPNQAVKLILFGSHARQTATPDSDIDLLVVLPDLHSPGDEILRMGDLKTHLNLKYDTLLSVIPITAADLTHRQSPLLCNIREEGISL